MLFAEDPKNSVKWQDKNDHLPTRGRPKSRKSNSPSSRNSPSSTGCKRQLISNESWNHEQIASSWNFHAPPSENMNFKRPRNIDYGKATILSETAKMQSFCAQVSKLNLFKLDLNEMRELLLRHGLPSVGTKHELIKTIQSSYSSFSAHLNDLDLFIPFIDCSKFVSVSDQLPTPAEIKDLDLFSLMKHDLE